MTDVERILRRLETLYLQNYKDLGSALKHEESYYHGKSDGLAAALEEVCKIINQEN